MPARAGRPPAAGDQRGLACCEGKLKHLGVPLAPKRSTLARANEHRPWQLYQTLFEQTLYKCREPVQSQGGRKKFRRTQGSIKLLPDHDACPPSGW